MADSFYEGTWSSGALPEEIVVFEMCQEFKWSWRDYQEAPAYFRRVFADLLYAKRSAENARHEREMSHARTSPTSH